MDNKPCKYKKMESARENTYFAGANSGEGFICQYGSIISEESFDKVYIIKGGPGTGKSSEIKRCISAAQNSGANVFEYRCGSDPASVDCAVFERNGHRIAVLDGTAPHTVEPLYAGACGEIVDFGTAWDPSLLEKRKNEIISLSKRKKACFEEAYKLLGGALEMRRENKRLLSEAIDEPKMRAAAERFLRSIGKKKDGGTSYCYTHGITMSGLVYFDSLERRAERKIYVTDRYGAGAFFVNMLFEMARDMGIAVVVSRSPLNKNEIIALGFEAGRVGVFIGDEEEEGDKSINILRFLKNGELSANRAKRRFCTKTGEHLINEACLRLKEAKSLHFRLEEIYGNATDYSKISRLGERMAEKILMRL